MTRFLLLLTLALLSGCAVTLYGNQTSGGGSTSTTTGSSVQGAKTIGKARVSGSFGAAPAPNAQGGQVHFSKGASAVLVMGVIIAGTVDAIGNWFKPAAQRIERLPDSGPVSQTCSCYGWQPDADRAD